MSESPLGPGSWQASDGRWYPPPPPPAYPPPYQASGGSGEPAQKTNGSAVTSLVLGILAITSCGPFLGIPAILVARKARTDIERSDGREGGESLAQIGRILGWVGSVLYGLMLLGMGVVFVGLLVFAGFDFPEEASEQYLPGGNCFDGPPDIAIGLLETFECTLVHDNEIYAAIRVDEGEDLEDEDVLRSLEEECEELVVDFTGEVPAGVADLEVSVIAAPPGSWRTDAYGLCVLSDPSGPARGTMEADD